MEENKEEYPQKIGIVQTGIYIPKPAETDVLGIAVRNIEEEEVY